MKINIRECAGVNCMTIEQGQLLHDQIEPVLRVDSSVELDFLGVRVFSSPFFHYSVGQLLKFLTVDQLREQVTFSNLSPVGSDTLELIIENAELYYNNAVFRQIKDNVMQEMATSL
jgi:hypothetical protein